MELILDNNDVKVKQAEYDREQIPGRVLGIYCRYKERTWELSSFLPLVGPKWLKVPDLRGRQESQEPVL